MGYRSSRSSKASESESTDDSALDAAQTDSVKTTRIKSRRDRRQDSTDNARLSTARPSDIETRSHQTDGDSIPSRRHTSQRLRENPALSKPGSAYDSDRVPDTIHWENYRSIQRSRATTHDQSSAGDTGVPESVRNVVSSPGHSLDTAVQRAMEDRMGDSFADVQIHTGARAASACDDINAKAFTVGNNIAFNSGEYDPSSAEGQHVIAHELAHVRQQTGGAVSMLPKDDVDLEIDPDPELEREAEETAQRVMQGGELGIQRMKDIEVHVQRMAEWGEHPLTNRDDDTEADTGVSYRDVLTTIAGSSLSATASHVIATNIAKEIGLVNPQAAVLTATAGIGITTAGAIAGKVELYKQIDPQILRRAFEAAGKEQLLADILNTLGHDTEWAESGDETEEVNY